MTMFLITPMVIAVFIDASQIAYDKCVSGGQIYNPSSIQSDLSKLNKEKVSTFATIPSLMKQLVSPKTWL
jgi:hypothetical protein